MDGESVYCVFCETSQEDKAETFLENIGYNVISALVERNVIKNEKLAKELRSLIPGYIFFETNSEPDWKNICKSKYIYYPLHYLDNGKKLKEKDLSFVKWLKGNNGIIKISKAIEIGKKIKIVEGPLMEMEGKIGKINKRQKCIGINLEGEGITNMIWLSHEYIENGAGFPSHNNR
jgi:transcription antitermination factor NusG